MARGDIQRIDRCRSRRHLGCATHDRRVRVNRKSAGRCTHKNPLRDQARFFFAETPPIYKPILLYPTSNILVADSTHRGTVVKVTPLRQLLPEHPTGTVSGFFGIPLCSHKKAAPSSSVDSFSCPPLLYKCITAGGRARRHGDRRASLMMFRALTVPAARGTAAPSLGRRAWCTRGCRRSAAPPSAAKETPDGPDGASPSILSWSQPPVAVFLGFHRLRSTTHPASASPPPLASRRRRDAVRPDAACDRAHREAPGASAAIAQRARRSSSLPPALCASPKAPVGT